MSRPKWVVRDEAELSQTRNLLELFGGRGGCVHLSILILSQLQVE